MLRRGGRLTVYLHGLLHLLTPTGRRQDIVVEVINGLPFGARLVRRRGLVAVTHHLHEHQWRMIYPGLPGKVGWFVESRLTPRLYRDVQHVTVSEATRRAMIAIGVPGESIRVVHNGLDVARVHEARSASPAPGGARTAGSPQTDRARLRGVGGAAHRVSWAPARRHRLWLVARRARDPRRRARRQRPRRLARPRERCPARRAAGQSLGRAAAVDERGLGTQRDGGCRPGDADDRLPGRGRGQRVHPRRPHRTPRGRSRRRRADDEGAARRPERIEELAAAAREHASRFSWETSTREFESLVRRGREDRRVSWCRR